MELKKVKADVYEFLYNPLTTDIHVNKIGEEWEIEIYKFKHYQGSLEVDETGKLIIVEDFNLNLKKIDTYVIEVM